MEWCHTGGDGNAALPTQSGGGEAIQKHHIEIHCSRVAGGRWGGRDTYADSDSVAQRPHFGV